MTKPWRNITTIWSDKKNCVFVFISVNLTGDSTGCLIAASCDNSAAFDDSHYLLCLGNNYLHNVLTPVK